MLDSTARFHSDVWIPKIKNLCLGFLSEMQNYPGGQYLRFSDELGTVERPGRIVKEYHRSVAKFKTEVYGENTEQELINYYKIAAFYIRSFLMHKPFYEEVPNGIRNPEFCDYTKLPNEYFVIPYLEAIFKGWNEDFDGSLELHKDRMFMDNFIQHLHRFKKNIETLDPVSFSATIRLIEKQYFRRSK